MEDLAQVTLKPWDNVAAGEHIMWAGESFDIVGPVNMDLLDFPIHDPNQTRAMLKIEVELAVNLLHAVARREDFHTQIRSAIEELVWSDENLLQPSFANKGNI